jgi:hypothetical protein
MARYLFEEEGYDYQFLAEAKWFWIWKFEQADVVVKGKYHMCGYCFKYDPEGNGDCCHNCPISRSDIRCNYEYLHNTPAETIFNIIRGLKRDKSYDKNNI